MKLLLTSAGITNKSIAKALFELVGKKPEETSLVFIPTASNGVSGDKEWVIDDLVNLKNLNLKQIAIVDISAVEEKIWKPELERADILFFEGGYTYYLMEWLNKSGLIAMLPELLKTRVYVGASAGSIVTGKDLLLRISNIIYRDEAVHGEDRFKKDMPALHFVDFYFLPHLGSEYFPDIRKEKIEEAISGMNETVLALDDNSALKVIDGTVEVITEGKYLRFN